MRDVFISWHSWGEFVLYLKFMFSFFSASCYSFYNISVGDAPQHSALSNSAVQLHRIKINFNAGKH
jgi:hypothetical protein